MKYLILLLLSLCAASAVDFGITPTSYVVRGTVTASNFVATAGGLTLPVLGVAPAVSNNSAVLWISNSAAPVLWITTTNGTFAH